MVSKTPRLTGAAEVKRGSLGDESVFRFRTYDMAATWLRERAAERPLVVVAGQAELLELTGLSASEVGQLIEKVCGEPPPAALAQAVHDRTAGNPFFTRQIARLLMAQGVPLDRALVGGVPPAVGDVLLRRLARLPREVVNLLAAAAVIGRHVPIAMAAAAAAAHETELVLEAHLCRLAALLELGEPSFTVELATFTSLAEQAGIPRYLYLARSRQATAASLTGPLEAYIRHDWTRLSKLAVTRGRAATPPEFALHLRAWLLVEAGDQAAAAAPDRFEDDFANPYARVGYVISTMVCTPSSLAQPGAAALGAMAGQARIRQVLAEAGYTWVRRVAREAAPFNIVLEARP